MKRPSASWADGTAALKAMIQRTGGGPGRRNRLRMTAATNGVVAGVAAALVAADVAILFAGVVARYLFRQPLVWSDELASILFLWLAMLGAAVACRRGEHMRMLALVRKLPPRGQAFCDQVAAASMAAFLLVMAKPAFDYAAGEIDVTTPALQIAGIWRAAAIPVGLGLMGFATLEPLLARRLNGHMFGAVGLVGAIVGGTILFSSIFDGLGWINLVIFFAGGAVLMVLAGIPIAIAFGLATSGYLVLGAGAPAMIVLQRMDEGMSHLILLAVPLFVFLGLLAGATGLAGALVSFLASLLGHVRGGLSYVLVAAMYLVSGISGSKAADMAAIAPGLFPEMLRRGSRPGDLVALLAATAAQTETIPPSLVLITLGSVTGVSVAALFTGGMLPAAVLAVMLCAVVWWRHRDVTLGIVPRAGLGTVLRSFCNALPALVLPLVIRTAVAEGIATATEVSTVGIVYTLVIGPVVYRRLDWRLLPGLSVDTACLSGAILLIIGTATGMAWALTQSGFAHTLAAVMATLPGGRPAFIAASVLLFVVVGSVLEGIPALVLFGPLLFPVARQVGVQDVHYAMIVILAMGLGLFAPPFGVGYYTACAISGVDAAAGLRPIALYLLTLLLGITLVAAIPWLSLGFL